MREVKQVSISQLRRVRSVGVNTDGAVGWKKKKKRSAGIMLQTYYFCGIWFREFGEGKGDESVFHYTLCVYACNPWHNVSPKTYLSAQSTTPHA